MCNKSGCLTAVIFNKDFAEVLCVLTVIVDAVQNQTKNFVKSSNVIFMNLLHICCTRYGIMKLSYKSIGGITMNIVKNTNGTALTLALEGRLDTTTAPELETVVKNELGDVKSLTFDLGKLEYISSAGLRVLLAAQKIMNKQGEMTVTGCSEEIMEIFEVTGFSDILNIQ